MSGTPGRRTIILGLDGATWDVLDGLLAAGRLPHLAEIIARGVRTTCRSTVPPLSPVAWSTIATGKNPGKHGVFDWQRRDPASYRLEPVTSRRQRGPTFWDLASEAGRRAGAFNVPVTYPPSPVNGFMVTSLLTPSNRVCFTHPPEASEALNRHVDGYEIVTPEVYSAGRERAFVDAMLQTVEKREAALHYMLETYPIDVGLLVYNESDGIQHKLWPADGFGEGEPPWPASGIWEVYERLDRAVGRLADHLGPDANLLVLSDHGAGPMRGVMFVNRWLMDQGYLRLRRSPRVGLKRFLARTDLLVRAYYLASRLGLGWLGRLVSPKTRTQVATSFISFDDVDWSRTVAYSFGSCGQIFLNLRGRECKGLVEPGAEADRLLDEIAGRLREVRDPDTGRDLITEVWRPRDLFHGPALADAPDLMFPIDDYARDASLRFGIGQASFLGEPESWTRGAHRMDGIFIAAGPDIAPGAPVQGMSLADVAPTALHLVGLPVPEDMDGRVVTEILSGPAAARAPARSAPGAAAPQGPEEASAAMTDEEQQAVEDRLRDLGYLD